MRTCVGYAGGTTDEPTYRRIGDHTESVQIDFDPSVITYEELLGIFWASHRPLTPAPSQQYASLLLTRGDSQHTAAVASLDEMSRRFGRPFTEVAPLVRFYPAEDYHQKYRLRADRTLMAEVGAIHPDPVAFRESTLAARLNGYLDGYGTTRELEAEIGSYGLSETGERRLRAAVLRP